MSLFVKNKEPKTPEKLTAKRAQEIYELFSAGKSATVLFTDHKIPFVQSKAVWAEIKRLESEITVQAGSSKPPTRLGLEGSLKSILDVKKVLADVIAYWGVYKAGRTWKEFVAGFETEV